MVEIDLYLLIGIILLSFILRYRILEDTLGYHYEANIKLGLEHHRCIGNAAYLRNHLIIIVVL